MKQKYTNEQKRECISAYHSGATVQAIVQKFSIPRSTVYSWLSQEQAKKKEPSLLNYRLMESKVQRLEKIIEILHTVNCSANSPLKVKLAVGKELYPKYNVHQICDALQVSRGTFYNYILRGKGDNIWYEKRKEELRIKIQQIYDDSRQIYGANKIAAALSNQEIKTSPRVVRMLMRDMGLISVRLGSKNIYDQEEKRRQNILQQRFDVSRPNEVWVSDVTCFRFNNKTFYICVIMDLYARRVIAYRVSLRNNTQLSKATVRIAYENRKPSPNSLIFHSDRGSNYCSKTFCRYLKDLNIIQSHSRAGVPYDNSVMESFFASMKREELYRTKYRSEREFRTAIDTYMTFYNESRPHSKNHYKTPTQKEKTFFDQ